MKAQDIEKAIVQNFDITKNLILPNVSFGLYLNYEADLLIITPLGYATEVEIKISKFDLLKDFKKKKFHTNKYNKYLYYAVPNELKDFALENVPKKYGIFSVEKNKYNDKYKCYRVRSSTNLKPTKRYSEEDIRKIYRLTYLRFWAIKQNKKYEEFYDFKFKY